MKKFLTAPVIALALFIGTAAMVPVAHAETCMGMELTGEALKNCQDSVAENDAVTPGYDATAIQASNDAAMQAAAKSATDLKENADDSYNFVMQKIMTLFAWLVGVAALTLDYAVYYTVVVMGNYIKGLTAVGISWRILRDIGNIMLIFGFLAVGISIILNTERLGYGKKMLPMLLVAAVFMNFSLFFTEAIIDTGNLFATQFFKQINGGNLPTTTSSGVLADAAGNAMTTGTEGISNKLMSQLGLQAIYGSASDPDRAKELFKQGNPWLIGFMGILLFIVTAFVLFSLAFILIARFVILIFLIIIAPIGFAGLAIPQLASTAKKWWNMLFQQTITAPVLLLMLYVALMVITDAQFLKGFGVSGAGSADASTGFIGNSNLPGFASFMLSFLVAMGLLIFVTILAKNLSAFGAGWATKTAGALSFGATAWAGRTTLGAGANRLGKYVRSTRLARVPIVGTGIIRGLDKAAAGSFDIRGIKKAGGLKGMGVEVGDAQKGGYKADLKARTESRTKYAAEIKGKEFKDLSYEEQFELAEHQKDLSKFEKQKKAARTVEELETSNKAIEEKQKEIKEFHKDKGTETGNKLKYAEVLTGERIGIKPGTGFGKVVNFFNPAANTEAAKKIKEEAKKSKDDKDLESLKKMLKKASGEEEPPAPPAEGTPAGGAPTGGDSAH